MFHRHNRFIFDQLTNHEFFNISFIYIKYWNSVYEKTMPIEDLLTSINPRTCNYFHMPSPPIIQDFLRFFMGMKDISEYQQHFKNCLEPKEKITFGSIMAWGCSTNVWKHKYLNNESVTVTTMNKILKRHRIPFIQQLAHPILAICQ